MCPFPLELGAKCVATLLHKLLVPCRSSRQTCRKCAGEVTKAIARRAVLKTETSEIETLDGSNVPDAVVVGRASDHGNLFCEVQKRHKLVCLCKSILPATGSCRVRLTDELVFITLVWHADVRAGNVSGVVKWSCAEAPWFVDNNRIKGRRALKGGIFHRSLWLG